MCLYSGVITLCNMDCLVTYSLFQPCTRTNSRVRMAYTLRSPSVGRECPETTDKEPCGLNLNCFNYFYNITGKGNVKDCKMMLCLHKVAASLVMKTVCLCQTCVSSKWQSCTCLVFWMEQMVLGVSGWMFLNQINNMKTALEIGALRLSVNITTNTEWAPHLF